jgi:hypothetical protein
MQKLVKLIIFSLFTLFIATACVQPTPKSLDNICNIFSQYPEWYWEAKATQDKWGVTVPVQMAIMYEESGFQAAAEPPPVKRHGISIPWHRQSTALGYCQALNGTWACYEKSTGKKLSRDEFSAASDFIGWYSKQVQDAIHIPPSDAYNLYLAYHEGTGGYEQKSYLHKAWLVAIAHNVEARALTYTRQLSQCVSDIPKSP